MITISEILGETEVKEMRAGCEGLTWRDGAQSAGGTAKLVKKNLQADLMSGAGAQIATNILAALDANKVLKAAAAPKQFSNLIVSKTVVGGGYGLHTDNALMGRGEGRMRTDLSFTLFLSEPEAYEGGELAVEFAGGTHLCKPAAGDLALYPSSMLHQVHPVTQGERLVCVGWIESLVRDPAQREILFDLQNLHVELGRTHAPGGIEMLTLAKSISNLMRLWALS